MNANMTINSTIDDENRMLGLLPIVNMVEMEHATPLLC
jgi:hypothetical protein